MVTYLFQSKRRRGAPLTAFAYRRQTTRRVREDTCPAGLSNIHQSLARAREENRWSSPMFSVDYVSPSLLLEGKQERVDAVTMRRSSERRRYSTQVIIPLLSSRRYLV